MTPETPLADLNDPRLINYRSLPEIERSTLDPDELIDAEMFADDLDESCTYGFAEQSLRVDSGNTLVHPSALSVLSQSGVAELRHLRVDETDNAIHLSGHVRSFYHKQLAQEAVRLIAGDRRVFNRICVRSSS